MPCYKPLTGYYSKAVNKSGKRSLVFNIDQALLPVKQLIPCGKCIGCRLDRSLTWAIRCVHEASLHEENSFVTLTFDDKHLGNGSLHVSDFQNFMKRLRKSIYPKKVRFFHCGEYGSKLSRPHHHVCLFGHDFSDKYEWDNSGGFMLYRSNHLEELWTNGISAVQKFTFETAAYVARYVLKKWAKDETQGAELYDQMKALDDPKLKDEHYGMLKPEYVTMSRRPGIGKDWYDKYGGDVYPGGFCLHDGKKIKPPRFYDSQFELDNPVVFAKIKVDRLKGAFSDSVNNTPARLAVREEIKKRLCNNSLKRGYENGTKSLQYS